MKTTMTEKDLEFVYSLGRDSEVGLKKSDRSKYDEFWSYIGSSPSNELSLEDRILWEKYLAGASSKAEEFRQEAEKAYNIKEFLKELDVLCKNYNVTMHFGCGCCQAGARCNDYDFSFEIPLESPPETKQECDHI